MDNHCYICGCDEVTKEDESKENDDWVKCADSYFRWFHSLCALYPGTGLFVCLACEDKGIPHVPTKKRTQKQTRKGKKKRTI